MTELFFVRILNMSLTGSFVILAVLAMRMALRKAPAVKRMVNGIPLAFGEEDTGSRIKNVLRYKKPAASLQKCKLWHEIVS